MTASVLVNPQVADLVKGPTPMIFVEIKGGVTGTAALTIKGSRALRRELLQAERRAMLAAADRMPKPASEGAA